MPNTSFWQRVKTENSWDHFCGVFSHPRFSKTLTLTPAAACTNNSPREILSFLSAPPCLFCQVSRTRNSIAECLFYLQFTCFLLQSLFTLARCIIRGRGNGFTSVQVAHQHIEKCVENLSTVCYQQYVYAVLASQGVCITAWECE